MPWEVRSDQAPPAQSPGRHWARTACIPQAGEAAGERCEKTHLRGLEKQKHIFCLKALRSAPVSLRLGSSTRHLPPHLLTALFHLDVGTTRTSGWGLWLVRVAGACGGCVWQVRVAGCFKYSPISCKHDAYLSRGCQQS